MVVKDEVWDGMVVREQGGLIEHTSPERGVRVEKGGHEFSCPDIKLDIEVREAYATECEGEGGSCIRGRV